MRILSLDVGEKRIGVALSDPTEFLASPLMTIEIDGEASRIEEILRLVLEYNVGEVAIGIPFPLSGRRGPQMRRVKEFIAELSKHITVPIIELDERLSSIQAKNILRESGVDYSKNKSLVDSLAATIILQAHLDSKNMSSQ